jgi:hypothetical protein
MALEPHNYKDIDRVINYHSYLIVAPLNNAGPTIRSTHYVAKGAESYHGWQNLRSPRVTKDTAKEKCCDKLSGVANFFTGNGSNICDVDQDKKHGDQGQGDDPRFPDCANRICTSNFTKYIESIVPPDEGKISFHKSKGKRVQIRSAAFEDIVEVGIWVFNSCDTNKDCNADGNHAVAMSENDVKSVNHQCLRTKSMTELSKMSEN